MKKILNILQTSISEQLNSPFKKATVFSLLITLPILSFFWHYLSSGSSVYVGDFDYYAQMYEAFRISVVNFHQFPLWNPWMAGGIALYANPQFGAISIQALLVLLFGTVFGLKLSYVVYAVAGFWGMYTFAKKVIGASTLRSTLVGYVWVFNGFFAGHTINHFTFALFFLLPWLLFFIVKWRERFSWLWLGLLVSLIALSAVHYALLMCGLTLAVYVVVSGVQKIALRSLSIVAVRDFSLFSLKALFVVLILCSHRIVMALAFVNNNPRPQEILNEVAPNIGTLLGAIFLPISTLLSVPTGLQWGWGEYSAYIGLGSSFAFLLISLVVILKRRIILTRSNIKYLFLPLAVISSSALLLALGRFIPNSPYELLHLLPGFTEARVSSRWLIMIIFSLLIILAATKNYKTLINVLLVIGIVELFIIYGPFTAEQRIGKPVPIPQQTTFSQTFSQYDNGQKHLDFAQNIRHSQVYTTMKNQGQIYGDDSTINTLNNVIGTARCGENVRKSCDLVLTDNADLVSWSPNEIVLERTADGPIELNMNPSQAWVVNKTTYPFSDMKRIDPAQRFLFNPQEKTIVLEYAPKFSHRWLLLKLQ